ncbi:MAG: hypothetical protein J3Q66DRAFT_417911 [Benniella sp.]|nr:MAG: hypothetical protein J3Q66DRAFT_417911 [Benniella sp.]
MLFISNPTMGTTWKVGENVFLQWKGNCASMGNPAAKAVDVNLMTGPDTALRFVARLASIDCTGTNTRKGFMIPADVVRETGTYSLQVLTEPQPSYSSVFSIETAAGGSAAAKGGVVNAAAGANSASVSETDTSGRKNAAGTSLLKNVGLTATASTVALAAVFVAAQLL